MDEREIREAKEEAARIIREAENVAREIYGASLEYVDDMLSEVNLAVLRSKEQMRRQMEEMLAEFDAKLDIISGNKQELLELLREHTKEGTQPIKKGLYEIKVDEEYVPKRTSYEVKIQDGTKTKVEVHKPAREGFEVKVADAWRERVEDMLAAEEEDYIEEPVPELEEKEPEGGYRAEDFDLDEEYFAWLEEQGKDF